MSPRRAKPKKPAFTWIIRSVYASVLTLLIVVGLSLTVILQTKEHVFESAPLSTASENEAVQIEPFPISVNPIAKRIEANTTVDQYYTDTLALSAPPTTNSWLARLTAKLATRRWYQQLASPVSRIFVIWPGERKEEVTKHVAGILGWNATETAAFVTAVTELPPTFPDGTFYPGQYVTHRKATPEEIATLINERFTTAITDRYNDELEAIVPLEDAIIIASLLEREASDFENMREVAGVIWNRQFIDMPLQLDATLQYARGSNPAEPAWWPAIRPSDKYVDSPYNTYTHTGLPPTPIANVSVEAVLAALNPIATDCLFYFHDSKRNYYCSATYEEHVAKLKQIYGQGR